MTMGGNFIGMDVQAVRDLATQMDNAARSITELMQRLTSQLQNTNWTGQDAGQFRSDWEGQHCQQLRSVADSLTQAANRGRQNAQQQEQASA